MMYLKTITGALEYIKKCGIYAYQYNTGKISDDDANPMLFAYVEDDLFHLQISDRNKYPRQIRIVKQTRRGLFLL